ncbi:MAG: thioredoxin TrxC [Pseudomonadota bacterium]|uniref:Thioredoxin n=1 Tax=Caldimonas aquatica TaxID=376175 RepID=A0ABY6MSY0_9BURK|nr:thioredoxin TrxC [Schlegelella aquatica]UZD55094.1 thioredoxin TrxC [Schlegelella aquatica]
MHIACPHCHSLNRVPDERLGEQPHCGRCKQPLLPGAPAELGDADFESVVGRTELPLLIDFWAPWCGPCRAMAPHFEQAAQALQGRVQCFKVNSDDNPKASVRYRIRSIPTLVLMRGGQEIARHSGAMSARDLLRWVETQLGAA